MRDHVYSTFVYIRFFPVFETLEDVVSAILFRDNSGAMHEETDTYFANCCIHNYLNPQMKRVLYTICTVIKI